MANRITIEGRTFESDGPISVIKGRVVVGGKLLTELKDVLVRIEVIGDLSSLTTDAEVTVNGNVQGDVDAGGGVSVTGNVQGDVKASGGIECGNVGGYAKAGGGIRAHDISGSVTAGGGIQCNNVKGGVQF